MTLVLGIRAIVALVGLLMFALFNGKPGRIGEIALFCGLLALLFHLR